MKLPYRRFDSFAMPLGDGSFAYSCIAECEHRVVVVAVSVADAAPLVLRVSDDALVLHRWKRDGVAKNVAPETGAQNTYWVPAARAERLAAAAAGISHPRVRRTSVREARSETISQALAAMDNDTVIALTEALDPAAFDELVTRFRERPDAMLRLNGGSIEHLPSLAAVPLQRLTLAERAPLPELGSLRELVVIGAPDVAAIARAFPHLESLTIDANGGAFDIAPLRTLPRLQALQISAGHLEDAQRLAELHGLRALRINRVTGIRDCSPLAALPLKTLALEHLHEVTSLAPLQRLESLEQLELHGLWQFDIADVEWTLGMKRLLRCEIDIGGRRKNVELYRRANWAYPWPFGS